MQADRSAPARDETTVRDNLDSLAERARSSSLLEQAVDRYAQTHQAIERQREQNLPVLEAQNQAYRTAAEQLEQARPGSHALMQSALQYDPKSAQAISELTAATVSALSSLAWIASASPRPIRTPVQIALLNAGTGCVLSVSSLVAGTRRKLKAKWKLKCAQ